MQPWESNDIDQTFRQAAEKAHFQYEKSNWDALNTRVFIAEKKALLVKLIASGSIAVMVGVSGYLMFNSGTASNIETESAGISEQIVSNQLQKVQPSTNGTPPLLLEKEDESGNNAIIDRQSNSDKVTEVVRETANSTARINVSDAGSIKKDAVVQKKLLANNSEEQSPDIILPDEDAPLLIKEESIKADYSIRIRSKKSLLSNEFIPINNSSMPLMPVNNVVEMEIIDAKSNFKGRFSLGFSYARDNSGISFERSQPGYGVGTTFSYGFTKRLSVVTGVFYEQKIYEINDGLEDYYDLWSQVQMPIYIAAETQLIEIPLNLRFNLVGSSKNNLFISSGLSTYFMIAEDYRFEYHYSEGSNAIPGIEVKGQNNHVFSIYNLSLGFQHRLTDRFGIEIEPYIKLPFGGIGIWDLNLTSSGAYLTARYYFR